MTDIATILITLPEKANDPTYHTAIWGRKAVAMAKDLGYEVVVLEKDQTTYQNVTKALEKYRPKVYVHMGHGCRTNIQGQDDCIITKNYNIDEMLRMAESPYIEERQKLLRMLDFEMHPLGQLSCPGICRIDTDPCADRCRKDTNVGLLKDTITFAVACFSGDQLARCAIAYGGRAYISYDDLFLFPVDRLSSQNLFGDIQLSFLHELLLGSTVDEAETKMGEDEDKLIRQFKSVKYMALSLLWDKIHRKIHGDRYARIYE